MRMWRRGVLASSTIAAGVALGLTASAMADTTAPSGGGQPQGTIQPSVALNYLIQSEGSVLSNIGSIKMFAGNFAPSGFLFAQGQTLLIVDYLTLFSVLGTNFGGDGVTTFTLPDLRGRTPIGTGQGPGLSNYTLGQTAGSEAVTLTNASLASHNHTLPGGGVTSNTGGGQPYNNLQPSLALNYSIALEGIFPTDHGGSNPPTGTEPLMGAIKLSASNVLGSNDAPAQGQLLLLGTNPALFSIIGPNFGGDVLLNTFALPDLRGRAPIGVGLAPGLTAQTKGQQSGQETVTMTLSQLTAHDHGLPPSPDSTGVTGGGAAATNMQPTLALHYIISLGGIFPPRDDLDPEPDAGPLYAEVELWAGDFAPTGWAFAEGQILGIATNTALFSLLGTTYGGNGITNFALPDLRDALVVGAGQGPGLSEWTLGEVRGDEENELSLEEMPVHTHEYNTVVVDAPEPVALSIFGLGLAGLGFALRRSRRPLS